jgi:hypothetical protein
MHNSIGPIENPWLKLPREAPYVLSDDHALVMEFNLRATQESQIRLGLLPEPFLGNPLAPVVLLGLNPGFNESDQRFHDNPVFAKRSKGNLLHDLSEEFPFYLLDPELSESPGHKWWNKHLGPLIEKTNISSVARGVLCIEFFPYHSKKFGYRKAVLSSQMYNFQLVRNAIERNAVIILMRGERFWRDQVPELEGRCYRLNSVQNVTISPKNCAGGFEKAVQALQRP